MKHFYISISIFIVILIGAFFSHRYVTGVLDSLRVQADTMTEIQDVTAVQQSRSKAIKDEFLAQKNMLQLFLNKEHIQQIETIIFLMMDSGENYDAEKLRENCIQLVCLLQHADSSLFAFA